MGCVAVRSIGKQYQRSSHIWARRLLGWTTGNRSTSPRAAWALRDVSFEAEVGESIGIVGMNGAGKSTLLKILAGTTRPTEGSFTLGGRVGAVLELGLGMHADFSGRENAVLACQLMGLGRARIAACLPQIEAFSELGEYMDRPVRTYSTGMRVRLAFSVATAVRPDVLIVDEALAVGDAHFQHKSIARIRAYIEQGTTLLFVTHDARALKALCTRAILLDRGCLLRDGPPDAVFDYYNAMIARKDAGETITQVADADGHWRTRSGSGEAQIEALELHDTAGNRRRSFRIGETATIIYRIRIDKPMDTPTVGFVIRDRFGADVFGTNTHHLGVPSRPVAAGSRLTVGFDVGLHVGCGTYSLSVSIHGGAEHVSVNFDWWDRALIFEVMPNDGCAFVGVAALPIDVRVSAEH